MPIEQCQWAFTIPWRHRLRWVNVFMSQRITMKDFTKRLTSPRSKRRNHTLCRFDEVLPLFVIVQWRFFLSFQNEPKFPVRFIDKMVCGDSRLWHQYQACVYQSQFVCLHQRHIWRLKITRRIFKKPFHVIRSRSYCLRRDALRVDRHKDRELTSTYSSWKLANSGLCFVVKAAKHPEENKQIIILHFYVSFKRTMTGQRWWEYGCSFDWKIDA